MKPTTKQIPFIGGLQFCFLTVPDISFDLDGIADLIDWAPLKRKVSQLFDREQGSKSGLKNCLVVVVVVNVVVVVVVVVVVNVKFNDAEAHRTHN